MMSRAKAAAQGALGAKGSGASAAPAAERTLAGRAGELLLRYGMVFALVGIVIVAQVLYPGFLAPQNISNILSQNAPLGIIAVGMTFVMVAGGFDLSVGALYAAGATFYASLAVQDISLPVAAALTVLVGLVAGAVNGAVVTRLKVNPFVATLGTSSIFGGAAFLYSRSSPFVVQNSAFTELGRGYLAGVPYAVLILVGVFVVGGVALAKTVYGRSIYAIGGNNEASRLAGMRVDLLRASTYVLVGACSTVAGMIIGSRLGVGQADIGATMALDAIAVVVIGGTSLRGGEGAIWRTAIGLLILAVITNLLDSLAVDANVQLVVKGAIVIGAVALDALARSRR